MDQQNQILIHIVRSIRYRFIKSTNRSPDSFGDFRVTEQTRTPAEIIDHMLDLAGMIQSVLSESINRPGMIESISFFAFKERFIIHTIVLEKLISETVIDTETSNKLIQGPLIDMATHIGQLAMLSGLAGNKIAKESFYDAKI